MDGFIPWFMNCELSYDWATLLLRFACGCALLPYGIKKFRERNKKTEFPSVLFFSSRVSFLLAMTVESLASICIILGLFTRPAAIAGICNMSVAFSVSKGPCYTSPALSFLLMFISILILGPGGYSLDHFIFRF